MGRRKENKVRYQLFLPQELSQRFEALAAEPGAAKSAILVDALTAWLNRQAVSELETRFSARLDRMSMALGRIERDGHILLRSEEHTSELQSLMRISYAVFCLNKKNKKTKQKYH